MMNQTQDQMRVDYEQLVKRVTEQDVYAHLQKGIPPSNKKVVQELEATKRNISQKLNETETLTPKAKKTLRDFNLALDSVELNLINKNRDNILQKFVYHAAQSSKKLNDALECMPKEQTDDVVRKLRTDMETLNRSLESLKDRTSDLLLGFANSSLSREILYELYRTIFNITESKLPKDEPPSVDVLNLTDDDIKLLESKLKTILEKIQDKPDVRDRLIGFIDLVDDIKSQFSSTVLKYVNDPALNQPINQPESSNPSLKAFDDEMRLAIQYFLQFLENAANGTSLNPTIESFSNLREVTMKDNKLGNELDSIGQDVKKFLKDCLSDKKFIHSEMYSSRFHFLSRKIDDVLIGQYSKEIRDLRDKLSYFLDNLANDPGMKQLSNEMTRVLNDMKIDPATADPADVLKDVYCFLTDVFPVILSGMDVIPVPRIESSDENFDLVLDNLRVCIDYIIPSKIHITSDTDLSQLKQKGVTFQERIRLTMNDIRFSAHNIAFLYNKKTGMIKTKDIGLLDLQDVVLDVDILLDFQTFVAEGRVEGVNADIAKKTLVSKSRIMVEAVDVKVSTLRMKFHNTSQDSYYSFFYPIIRMKMKSAMKSMMSDMVRDTLAKSMDPNYIRHEKNIFGSTTGVEIGREVEA